MLVKSFTYVILHYSERIDITRVKILVFHMFEIVQLCNCLYMYDRCEDGAEEQSERVHRNVIKIWMCFV